MTMRSPVLPIPTIGPAAAVGLAATRPTDAAISPLPKAALDISASAGKLDTAVFAGGCFWGIEAVFEHVRGVTQAVSGYAGGSAAPTTYEEVSSGSTGHA